MSKILLGYVALYKTKDNKLKAYPGGQYSAGAKVYKSEKMAKAAVNGAYLKANSVFIFVPAYAEIENVK